MIINVCCLSHPVYDIFVKAAQAKAGIKSKGGKEEGRRKGKKERRQKKTKLSRNQFFVGSF